MEPVELDLEPANLLEEPRDELLVLTCEGSSIVAKDLGKRVDGLFLPCADLGAGGLMLSVMSPRCQAFGAG